MKKIIRTRRTLLLLITPILILSTSRFTCEKEDFSDIQAVNFNKSAKLSVEDQVVMPKGRKELLIRLESLSDSRCPANVQCVWEGNAVAGLKIQANNGDETFISLCIGECKKDETAFVPFILNGVSYTITLNEVGISTNGRSSIAFVVTKK